VPKPKGGDRLKLLSFNKALEQSEGFGKRHLMLGNGFSIALKPDIFTYTALFDQAKNAGSISKRIGAAFRAMNTSDFETVIRVLRDSAVVVPAYLKDKTIGTDTAKLLCKDADAVRELLARTVSDSHPERPGDVTEDQYTACRQFLSNFDGSIYTLNYDLLLYWTVMQDLEPEVHSDDGFRTPDEGEEDYVTWDIEKTTGQNIFYLHGALHIYDAGHELQKYTWVNTGVRLIEQIRSALDDDRFPLIVSEGRSNEKLTKIIHSNYLSRGYRSFAAIGGSLFIYGHSLAENDEHILKLIPKSKVKNLFVGIYGDQKSPDNKRIIARAQRFPAERRHGTPLGVSFFDASTAEVWGESDD